MTNLFQPGISDGFQKQLDDLQRSYAQLGKIQQPIQQEKHEFKKISDIDTAKSWAKENLAPGESFPLFDENKDQFYAVRRRRRRWHKSRALRTRESSRSRSGWA